MGYVFYALTFLVLIIGTGTLLLFMRQKGGKLRELYTLISTYTSVLLITEKQLRNLTNLTSSASF